MGLRRRRRYPMPSHVSLLPHEANHVHEMKVFFMFPAWRGASSAETNGGGSPRLPVLCRPALSLPAEMISIWGALQGWLPWI